MSWFSLVETADEVIEQLTLHHAQAGGRIVVDGHGVPPYVECSADPSRAGGRQAAGSKVPNAVCDPSAVLLIDDGLAGRGQIDLVPT